MKTKKRTARYANPGSSNWLGIMGTIFSLLLVALGVVTLILVQRPIQESQDLRRAASVADGIASVTPSLSVQSGNVHKLSLAINTNNLQTHGVQLIFKLKTDVINDLQVAFAPDTGMSAVYLESEAVSDGYLVSLIATPNLGQPFANNSNQTLLDLTFTPTQDGTATIEFDNNHSFVLAYDDSRDELKTPQNQTFNLETTADDTDDTDDTQDDSDDDSEDEDTTTNGTGGATIASCNESCASNSDCSTNLYCYQGACRLPTNPTSSQCQGPADQGLNRTCNEYCANVGECASGYTCYFNRCRQPENPESSTCAAPSTQTSQTISQRCNTTCSVNADCGTNMACYNGQCRLASYPSSTSCAAPTQQTITTIYTTTPDPKGGSTVDFDEQDESATNSGALGQIGEPSPSPSPLTEVAETPEAEDNALAALVNELRRRGPLFPAAMIGSGIFLIGLIVLLLLSRRGGAPQPATKATFKSTPKDTAYMNDLQTKINALKTETPTVPSAPKPATPAQPLPSVPQQAAPAIPSAPSYTPPFQPSTPPKINEEVQQVAEAVEEATDHPQPANTPPAGQQPSYTMPRVPLHSRATTTQVFQTNQQNQPASGSSMVDRLKAKGVQPSINNEPK